MNLVIKVMNLTLTHPELCNEWDYKLNYPLKPENFTYGSGKKVYWYCNICEYGWETRINHRTSDSTGCPRCNKNRVQIGINDLLSQRPDIAKQWDYETNQYLRPEIIAVNSNKKVYWKCEKCGYKWMASVQCRVKNKLPYCPNCIKGIHTSYPEQFIYLCMKEILPETISRGKVTNIEVDVLVNSLKLAIEYDGCRYHNTEKSQEKEHKKNKKLEEMDYKVLRVKEDRDIKEIILKDNMIYTPLHNNDMLKLINIIKNILIWINKNYNLTLKIKIPKNIEEKVIENVAILDEENSLFAKFPEIAKEYHSTKNGSLKSNSISSGSHKKVWWLCPDCGEPYKAIVRNRTLKGSGCKKCGYKRVSEKLSSPILRINDLESQYPEVAKDWDYVKNKLKPWEVYKNSGYKVYWKCYKCGFEWQDTVNNRIFSGRGCRNCIDGDIPIRSKNVVKGKNDLASTANHLLIDWDYGKNVILPTQLTKGSHKMIHWKCHICNKEWVNSAKKEYERKTRGCISCRIKNTVLKI